MLRWTLFDIGRWNSSFRPYVSKALHFNVQLCTEISGWIVTTQIVPPHYSARSFWTNNWDFPILVKTRLYGGKRPQTTAPARSRAGDDQVEGNVAVLWLVLPTQVPHFTCWGFGRSVLIALGLGEHVEERSESWSRLLTCESSLHGAGMGCNILDHIHPKYIYIYLEPIWPLFW